MTDEESRKAWEEWSTGYLKRYGWPKHIGAIAWQAAWTEATKQERENRPMVCPHCPHCQWRGLAEKPE